MGHYSTHSAIGATKSTTTHPTPRSNRTASRKPASPIKPPTQVAVVGWLIRRTLLGHHWCRPLTLLQTCPNVTTCAVELTLLNDTTSAIISCYLPETLETHAITCDALSNYPTPSHTPSLFWGIPTRRLGTFVPEGHPHRYSPHTKGGRGTCSPPSLRANNRFNRHVLTTSLNGTPNTFRSRRRTQLRSKPPFWITRGSWIPYTSRSCPRRHCLPRWRDPLESFSSSILYRNPI